MPAQFIGGPSQAPGARRPPEYTFKVIRTFPHDPTAFTQGLVYHDGFFYEGTGLNGRSSLRKVRPETGEVVQHLDLPNEYFGEGIAIVRNKVIQLTVAVTCRLCLQPGRLQTAEAVFLFR